MNHVACGIAAILVLLLAMLRTSEAYIGSECVDCRREVIESNRRHTVESNKLAWCKASVRFLNCVKKNKCLDEPHGWFIGMHVAMITFIKSQTCDVCDPYTVDDCARRVKVYHDWIHPQEATKDHKTFNCGILKGHYSCIYEFGCGDDKRFDERKDTLQYQQKKWRCHGYSIIDERRKLMHREEVENSVAKYCTFEESSPLCRGWADAAKCRKHPFVPKICPLLCGVCETPPDCYGKQCLNGGSLDLESCKCTCDFMYKGATCEERCPDYDPPKCMEWPKRYCEVYPNVHIECPFLCGICERENERRKLMHEEQVENSVANYCTSEDPSDCRGWATASLCKNYRNVPVLCPLTCGVCEKDPGCYGKQCLNGGSLDLESCKCTCDFMYKGDTCEERCPNKDESRCNNWSKSDCKIYSNVVKDCPFKCGVCETDDCGGKQCLNGGSLDLESCKCTCDFMYKGDTCEERCPDNDQLHCRDYPLSYCQTYPNVLKECPFMCGLCEKEIDCSFDEHPYCKSLSTSNCRTYEVFYMCPFLCGTCDRNELQQSFSCSPDEQPFCKSNPTSYCQKNMTTFPVRCPHTCGLCDQELCTEAYQEIEGHTMCLENSPKLMESPVMSSAEVTEIVDRINDYRRNVQPSATNMQHVKWDPKLAEVAQKWAKQCRTGAPLHDGGKQRSIPGYTGVYIGQNAGYGHASWSEIIDQWYDEVTNFKHGVGNKCPKDPDCVISHYTQVVLHRVARVGCGYAQCTYKQFRVCNFAYGQYSTDIPTPYTSGVRGSACLNDDDGLCDCGGKLCLNGGSLDVGSCTCSCPRGFKGDICEDDCGGKRCWNRGTLDLESCTCNCAKLYKGDTCKDVDCPSEEPSSCRGFATAYKCRTFANVPGDCPFSCGLCKKD